MMISSNFQLNKTERATEMRRAKHDIIVNLVLNLQSRKTRSHGRESFSVDA